MRIAPLAAEANKASAGLGRRGRACWSGDGCGGGGIGVGGYRFSSDLLFQGQAILADVQATQFAWQAGGGIVYAVSDRITLDLGYRFYSLDDVSFVIPSNNGQYTSQFSANELLFQIRIYEPFRGRG